MLDVDRATSAIAACVRANAATLTDLDLQHSPHDRAAAESLASAIGTCGSLHSLSLTAHHAIPDYLIMVGRALAACPALARLRISSEPRLERDACDALAASLASCARLTNLSLASAPDDAAAGRVVRSCPALEELDLRDVPVLGLDAGLSALAVCKRLKRLVLDAGPAREARITPEGAAELGRGLAECPSLESLEIRGWLRARGAAALAPGLAACARLVELRLNGVGLGDEGIAALAPSIEACPRLEHVDVGGNSIGNAGALAWGRAAASAPRHGRAPLASLVVSSNPSIHAEGLAGLLQVLESRDSVTKLNLFNVEIGDAGAAMIAAHVRARRAWTTQLAELNVGEGDVGDEGVLALAGALELGGCPLLTSLNVEGVELQDASIAALARALVRLPRFERLVLYREECLGDEAASAVVELVRRAPRLRVIDTVHFSDTRALRDAVAFAPRLESLGGNLEYQRIVGLPRNLAYWEFLAFAGATAGSDARLVPASRGEVHPVRRFLDSCGDGNVTRRVVRMLMG